MARKGEPMRITSRFLTMAATPIQRRDIAEVLMSAWRETPPGPNRRARAVQLAAERCRQVMTDKQNALKNVKIFAPHRADKIKLTADYWGLLGSQISELGYRHPIHPSEALIIGAGNAG